MDITEKLKAEQLGKLKELQSKLGEVLDYEPADSGDKYENKLWEEVFDLKESLDAFLMCRELA